MIKERRQTDLDRGFFWCGHGVDGVSPQIIEPKPNMRRFPSRKPLLTIIRLKKEIPDAAAQRLVYRRLG